MWIWNSDSAWSFLRRAGSKGVESEMHVQTQKKQILFNMFVSRSVHEISLKLIGSSPIPYVFSFVFLLCTVVTAHKNYMNWKSAKQTRQTVVSIWIYGHVCCSWRRVALNWQVCEVLEWLCRRFGGGLWRKNLIRAYTKTVNEPTKQLIAN